MKNHLTSWMLCIVSFLSFGVMTFLACNKSGNASQTHMSEYKAKSSLSASMSTLSLKTIDISLLDGCINDSKQLYWWTAPYSCPSTASQRAEDSTIINGQSNFYTTHPSIPRKPCGSGPGAQGCAGICIANLDSYGVGGSTTISDMQTELGCYGIGHSQTTVTIYIWQNGPTRYNGNISFGFSYNGINRCVGFFPANVAGLLCGDSTINVSGSYQDNSQGPYSVKVSFNMSGIAVKGVIGYISNYSASSPYNYNLLHFTAGDMAKQILIDNFNMTIPGGNTPNEIGNYFKTLASAPPAGFTISTTPGFVPARSGSCN